jgi:hypothetical protein
MDLRFEQAPQKAIEMLASVRKDIQFNQLVNANILVVMDLKKRTSGGKLVAASLSKTNDIERFLTLNEAFTEDGYDYIMRIDKALWESPIEDIDRIRIIRHELCHADVDAEADKPYKIQAHEVEDFYSEILFNQDDPKWMVRLGGVLESIYSKEKENETDDNF